MAQQLWFTITGLRHTTRQADRHASAMNKRATPNPTHPYLEYRNKP